MYALIDEYPLVFLPTLACQYGLNEAIVIQQIHYWQRKNKPMEDGYTWVYNSIPEWKKQFPFWSERTIFSILKRLRDINVLIAERKSDNPWNQTLYYRLNEEIFDAPILQPLRDRPRKSCDITVNTETTREYIDRFDIFWKQYPRKVSKEAARIAWLKLKPDAELLEKIIKAIKDQKLSDCEIQFVPHAATWLNRKRWEDEVAPSSSGSTDWWMNDRRIK